MFNKSDTHVMRKELWDRQGANTASRSKEISMAKSYFHVQKKGILETDQHFVSVVLSQMDMGNVDRRKM